MDAAQQMKQLKRYLKKQVRRNERRMTTKKARKAWGTIALTILTLLVLNQVVSIARAAMEPTILTFENKPLNWDVRIEAESAKPEAEHKDEVKDGALVVGGIEEKIAQAFPEHPELMIAIAKAESGLNPYAMNKNRNGSTDTGLFQINSIHGHDQLELTKVDKNIEVARKVYEKQGLGAWVAYTNKSFEKFLK